MIHKRNVSTTITIGEFFEKNDIPDTEDTFVDIPYELKVRTPYGYYRVPQVCRTEKQTSVCLYFANNTTLECGWEHKLKVNGEWKLVSDIKPNEDLIETDNGHTTLVKIDVGLDKILYDLSVDEVHCFYSNGILSHNTWALCAIGASAVRLGYNVVHYTLELSEHYVGIRYDTIFSSVPSENLRDESEKVRSILNTIRGKLLIKYIPSRGVTTRFIEHHLEKLIAMGNKPDLVIIDYADLMLSQSSKVDSTYQEQGNVYIELRGISGTLGIPILTASQTNRSGMSADIIEADKIADSYAKVMNADFIMSLSRKAKDKVNGTARVHIMKNRFGPDGMSYMAKLDTTHGIFDILDVTANEQVDTDEKSVLYQRYMELSPQKSNPTF